MCRVCCPGCPPGLTGVQGRPLRWNTKPRRRRGLGSTVTTHRQETTDVSILAPAQAPLDPPHPCAAAVRGAVAGATRAIIEKVLDVL